MPPAALFAAVTATTAAFYRVDPNAGHLMLPYLAFTGFANALNYRIWMDNPGVSVRVANKWVPNALCLMKTLS
jgi:tryptophan-rich sensory protein